MRILFLLALLGLAPRSAGAASVCFSNFHLRESFPDPEPKKKLWLTKRLCMDALRRPSKVSVELVTMGFAFYKVVSVREESGFPAKKFTKIRAERVVDPEKWIEITINKTVDHIPLGISSVRRGDLKKQKKHGVAAMLFEVPENRLANEVAGLHVAVAAAVNRLLVDLRRVPLHHISRDAVVSFLNEVGLWPVPVTSTSRGPKGRKTYSIYLAAYLWAALIDWMIWSSLPRKRERSFLSMGAGPP
jgi:hypothetical protein